MRSLTVLLAVVALTAPLSACGQNGAADGGEPDTPIDEVTVRQLLADPDAYDGAEVIVADATVRPIEPEGGFILDGDDGRILVSAPDGTPAFEPGDEVRVRAEVVRFTEPAAETLGAGFGGLEDVPTDVGDPYLLLRSATTASTEGSRRRERAADVMRDPGDRDDPAATPLDLRRARRKLAQVARHPEYGADVVVAGRVTRSDERAFVLAAHGERLLIVPQFEPEQRYEVGADVRARGVVERLPADEAPGIVGEDALFEDFEGEPTLAADDIVVVS